MNSEDLNRDEIARILVRHAGSKAEVARRAGVKPNAVSMWLAGGPNANVEAVAKAHALELLDKEEAARLARGEANGLSARKVVEALRKGDPEVQPIIEKLLEKGTGGE
jgi:predicted transcriptional regulator